MLLLLSGVDVEEAADLHVFLTFRGESLFPNHVLGILPSIGQYFGGDDRPETADKPQN